MEVESAIIEIEPTEKNEVDALPVKYNITDAAINQLRVQYTGLEITDKSSYKAVISAIADVRGRRTSVEKRRKELKAGALDYGRRVDGEAKRITGLLEEIEEPLKEKKLTEDSKETKRIAFIQGRIEAIGVMVPTIPTSSDALSEILFDLDTMVIGADFEEFREQAEAVRLEASTKINKLIIDRIQWEKEESDRKAEMARLEAIKAENARIEAERKAKAEAEEKTRRAEREAFEVEKRALAEEREKIEAVKREEQERKGKEENEKKERIKAIETQRYNGLLSVGYQYPEIDLGIITEAEYQELYQGFKAIWDKEQEQIRIKAEEKAAHERVEFERIAKENAELETKERQEREEEERKATAEAEAAEAKRQEALKPDREKLLAFAESLVMCLIKEDCRIMVPDVSSEKAVSIMDNVLQMLEGIKKYILDEVEKL